MSLVYRLFMWWTRKVDRFRLEQSDGFQIIQNSCHMRYHENDKLSTRGREEYTGHEKLLIGFYSSGEPEIEEILDGSPTSDSHRSAHFFRFFLVSGRVSSGQRNRMKRNTLSRVSCIATVSINTYSLHSATILTHTIACSHIFSSERKHCYSRNDVRSQLVPFSAIPRS